MLGVETIAQLIPLAQLRDGHIQWVMDIQPYPIQMFQVILGSSWVELNRVGYGYYPNPTCIKKKKKKPKPLSLTYVVHSA